MSDQSTQPEGALSDTIDVKAEHTVFEACYSPENPSVYEKINIIHRLIQVQTSWSAWLACARTKAAEIAELKKTIAHQADEIRMYCADAQSLEARIATLEAQIAAQPLGPEVLAYDGDPHFDDDDDQAYRMGWNDCRGAVLAATPKPRGEKQMNQREIDIAEYESALRSYPNDGDNDPKDREEWTHRNGT